MFSLTLSHVGIYVTDMAALIEKHVRATSGFKPIAEWRKDVEARIARAGAQRRNLQPA